MELFTKHPDENIYEAISVNDIEAVRASGQEIYAVDDDGNMQQVDASGIQIEELPPLEIPIVSKDYIDTRLKALLELIDASMEPALTLIIGSKRKEILEKAAKVKELFNGDVQD